MLLVVMVLLEGCRGCCLFWWRQERREWRLEGHKLIVCPNLDWFALELVELLLLLLLRMLMLLVVGHRVSLVGEQTCARQLFLLDWAEVEVLLLLFLDYQRQVKVLLLLLLLLLDD